SRGAAAITSTTSSVSTGIGESNCKRNVRRPTNPGGSVIPPRTSVAPFDGTTRSGLVTATPVSGELTLQITYFLPAFRTVTLKPTVEPTVQVPRNNSTGTLTFPPHAGQMRVSRQSQHVRHHHCEGFMHTKQLANASGCSFPQSGHRATTSIGGTPPLALV